MSLTSPSVLADRTALATPIQGCWPLPLLARTARVSDSCAPPLPLHGFPLFTAPFPSWLQTVMMLSLILGVFGDVVPAQHSEGQGAWQRFSPDADGAVKSILSSARILTMQKFIEADYYELDWYYEECSDGNYGSYKTERDV